MKKGFLKINKGFFYGAGSPKIFNWVKDDFHMHGVGINLDTLNDYDVLILEINEKTYKLDTSLAKNFIEHYNSFKKARGIVLGVVSRSLLYEINT